MDSSNAIGLLGAHAAPVLTALAAVTLALFGVSRWRHRLRVNAEYAAALALIRAPYTLREALSDCRSHIIESGETPPGWRGPMDSLIAADAAVREALPAIVGKYRSAGGFVCGFRQLAGNVKTSPAYCTINTLQACPVGDV